MNSKIWYKNIFLYASLQFCGNIEAYFKNHTENLLVFIVMPRVNNKFNLLRQYKRGKLVKEKKVISSSNIFFYYLLWYFHYLTALVNFPAKEGKITVISFHPISFFFMYTQKLFMRVNFVYWIGDYFPGVNISLVLYEKLKKYFHDSISYTCYLSDRINKKMNGKILRTANRKTVMWGVNPKKIKRTLSKKSFTILFVGLIKESQGLESVFNFLKTNKEYKLKIVGVCEQQLFKKYKKIISAFGLTKRVYFPNIFVDDEKLLTLSQDCHVGIALYDTNPTNATNFADPGKVKSYAEMKLPVIMSDISDIAAYVRKFHSGIVIKNDSELLDAFTEIKKNYPKYQNGLEEFNKHFFFEDQYKKSFAFLQET